MYGVLLVSTDREFLALAMKFVPHLDQNISVYPVSSQSDAMIILDRENIDVMAFDQRPDNDFFQMINLMDRAGKVLPSILMSSDAGSDLLIGAINRNIDAFIKRGGSPPMDFFKEFNEKVVILAERRRNERDRRINESRMEALVNMAKMSDRDFSEVVNYALEKAVELTRSRIGYVAVYDRKKSVLRMLAWSKGAMRRCDMSNYPVEFDLNTTGVWGEPIRMGKTIIINDYENDRRMIKKGLPMGHVPLKRLLMVPISVNNELIGTAGVGNKSEDYTWFDEVQLTLLMEEMFSIYSKLERVKEYSGQTQIVRELTEAGPVGFMFVTSDMDVVFLNKVAAKLLGTPPVTTSLVPFESISTRRADEVRSAINACRMDGTPHRFRTSMMDNSVERFYDVSVTPTGDIEGMHPGYTVVMNDITEVQRRDSLISRAIDHIRILEGPVLRTMMDSRADIEGTGLETPERISRPVRRMEEAISFMDDYRNVGITNQVWLNLEEAIQRAVAALDMNGIVLDVHVKGMRILADPALPIAFRHLISNSISHGMYTTEIGIGCRISQGNLTVTYRDNGAGIPEDIRYSLFDQVYKGKFGMFLVQTIMNTSGFTIENVSSDRGAVFEITVPPSHYSLG